MLSSDKNIERLADLIAELKTYGELQKEYLWVNIVDKLTRIAVGLTIVFVAVLLSVLALFYLSMAAVYWAADYIGLNTAFAAAGALCIIILIVAVKCRKRWIERPLVKFLSSVLL